MKATVCELPNEAGALEEAWKGLCAHVRGQGSEFVLLPEMPFFPWLAHTQNVSSEEWEASVQAHNDWAERLSDLAPATVVSTRPTMTQGIRRNMGYVWDSEHGRTDVHAKYYLPNEPAYWEATWYSRGNKAFEGHETAYGKIGFLICTELWFTQHAREYGKQGVQVLVCPRVTPRSTAAKWVTGGQVAAVVSGAFCLSSNLAGKTSHGGDFAGVGWIIEPEEGQVLGLTSPDQPFLTVELDLSIADQAKHTYPRYVLD
jgi:N-carbamoylputrescine amidase